MLSTGLKVAVTGVLIWWLASNVDLLALRQALLGANLGLVATGFLILLALSAVQAFRWSLVARLIGIRIRPLTNWSIVLIGLFFNQALPSTVGGDAMRVYLLKKLGFTIGVSFNSIVLDRYVAYLGLMTIVAVGQPWLLPLAGDGLLQWGAPIVLALGALAAIAVPTIDLVPLPQRLRGITAVRGISDFAGDARKLLSTPTCIGPTLLISLTGHVAIASVIFLLALALGLTASYLEILILFPPVFLLSLLPISIAGWGVREGAMVTALGFIDVDPAAAIALSILFGALTALSSLPGGVIWLLRRSKAKQTKESGTSSRPSANSGAAGA